MRRRYRVTFDRPISVLQTIAVLDGKVVAAEVEPKWSTSGAISFQELPESPGADEDGDK